MSPARLACALILFALGGCSVLPKREAPTVYRLPQHEAAPRPAAASAWSLQIDAPLAERAIDGSRIAVVPQDNVISTYKGARWSDRPAILLRERLLDAFQADGRAQAVSDDANVHADYELAGDLRAFQAEYEQGRPVVVIRYDARLLDERGQRILAARRFELRQPVAGKEVAQVVAAFGQAGDALAAQVTSWTIMQAQASGRSSGK